MVTPNSHPNLTCTRMASAFFSWARSPEARKYFMSVQGCLFQSQSDGTNAEDACLYTGQRTSGVPLPSTLFPLSNGAIQKLR